MSDGLFHRRQSYEYCIWFTLVCCRGPDHFRSLSTKKKVTMQSQFILDFQVTLEDNVIVSLVFFSVSFLALNKCQHLIEWGRFIKRVKQAPHDGSLIKQTITTDVSEDGWQNQTYRLVGDKFDASSSRHTQRSTWAKVRLVSTLTSKSDLSLTSNMIFTLDGCRPVAQHWHSAKTRCIHTSLFARSCISVYVNIHRHSLYMYTGLSH